MFFLPLPSPLSHPFSPRLPTVLGSPSFRSTCQLTIMSYDPYDRYHAHDPYDPHHPHPYHVPGLVPGLVPSPASLAFGNKSARLRFILHFVSRHGHPELRHVAAPLVGPIRQSGISCTLPTSQNLTWVRWGERELPHFELSASSTSLYEGSSLC